jgi:uncharacterized protein HemY
METADTNISFAAISSIALLLAIITTTAIIIIIVVVVVIVVVVTIAIAANLVSSKEAWPWENSKRCHRAHTQERRRRPEVGRSFEPRFHGAWGR